MQYRPTNNTDGTLQDGIGWAVHIAARRKSRQKTK